MARKFQIGDTVQVVKDTEPTDIPLGSDFQVGHRGVVIEYEHLGMFPYHVQRKNYNETWFKACELKLIKKK